MRDVPKRTVSRLQDHCLTLFLIVEKERKKADKEKKFKEKKAKLATNATNAGTSKNKEKKEKLEAAKDAPLPEYVEETPVGEKKFLKSLDDEYYKAYRPQVVESAWYAWWEKQGYLKPEFKADGNVKDEGTFSIPIPPPNGKLFTDIATTDGG